MNDAKFLLEGKENEDLAFAGLQRLERFSDERARTMHLDAGDIDWLRLHRHSGLVAGDEKIADRDRRFRCVDANLHAARRCDFCLVGARDAERDSRLLGNNTGNGRIVRARRRDHLIRDLAAESHDGSRRELLGRRNPFGDVLILRLNVRARDGPVEECIAVHFELACRSRRSDTDVAIGQIEFRIRD